jgi:hypothetical protein
MIDPILYWEQFRDAQFHNFAVRQHDDEVHLFDRTPNRIGEGDGPERNRRCSELLRFESTNLDVVKRRHEVRTDLRCLFLRDGLGGVLLPGVEESKTYSSVPPSLAAPLYRNNSTANAGVAAMTKAARIRTRTDHTPFMNRRQ